jgi:hypothetical protein
VADLIERKFGVRYHPGHTKSHLPYAALAGWPATVVKQHRYPVDRTGARLANCHQLHAVLIDPAQKRYNTVPHSFRVFAE